MIAAIFQAIIDGLSWFLNFVLDIIFGLGEVFLVPIITMIGEGLGIDPADMTLVGEYFATAAFFLPLEFALVCLGIYWGNKFVVVIIRWFFAATPGM